MSFKQKTVIVVLCALSLACEERVQTKFDSGAEAKAAQRREEIQAEINRIGTHDWAGEYYQGDGLGENVSLSIAPQSGFVFEWDGCLGVYDRNYGDIEFADRNIKLSCVFPNSHEGFEGIAEDFVVVPWGERRYLIPSDDFLGFCNEVNSGSEPRDGMYGFYLMRRGDETISVSGLPEVPEAFRKYLLDSPIEATIIDVGQPTTQSSVVSDTPLVDYPVTLNAGTRAGLFQGMELQVTSLEFNVASVSIVEVEQDTAKGIVSRLGDQDPVPEVGWKVSTRAPYY